MKQASPSLQNDIRMIKTTSVVYQDTPRHILTQVQFPCQIFFTADFGEQSLLNQAYCSET